MKKPRFSICIAITAVFAAFTLGLFLGRNQTGSAVTVSLPASMQTMPPETTAAPEVPTEETVPITFPININTAGKEAFMALPGIGEVLADRILAYREENGSFSTVNSLMSVEGIGEKRLQDMLDFITIGG